MHRVDQKCIPKIWESYIKNMFKGGDGRQPKRGANSIELVYLQDPGVLEKYLFH